jgi:hypothetical protein
MSDTFIDTIAAREKQAEERRARLSKVYFVSGEKMMKKDYPQPRYLWQGILPDSGLAVCASSKASGKTLLLLQLADAIARGRDFLGIPTIPAKILFLELELSEAKTTQRLRKMGITTTDNLIFSYNTKTKQWPQGEEGLKTLRDAIEEHSFELVIVDVLQRLWPMNADFNSYQDSYNVLAPLRQLANDLGVLIILVTHRRKMETADFLDGVMGSVGIVANADVILSIQRQRGENEAVLFCEGNDIESKQLALQFEINPLGFTLSDASPGEIGQTQERRAILDALRELGVPMKTGEIAKAAGKSSADVSMLLNKLARQGLVVKVGYGLWTLAENFKRAPTIESIESVESALQVSTTQEDTLQTDFKRPIESIESAAAKSPTLNGLNGLSSLNRLNSLNASLIQDSEMSLLILLQMMNEYRTNLRVAGFDPLTARVELADWQRRCIARGISPNSLGAARDYLLTKGKIKIDGEFIEPNEGEDL